VPHITLLATRAVAHFPDAPPPPGTLNLYLGSMEDGAEVASYSPATDGFDPQMHVDSVLTFGIAFGQGSATPGLDCSVTLKWIHSHITNIVLPDLIPFLS